MLKRNLLVFLFGVMIMAGMTFGVVAAEKTASFAEFDRKAQAKEPLTVVFFGGSLTWGANASDPLKTSYRGQMMDYLRHKYPNTPFTFYDAAIGGTGSNLGIFRLDRDVLKYNPDLVFLDFTANDGLDDKDRETLVAYETLLRRMISAGIPVEQAFFGFKWQFGNSYKPDEVWRRLDHMKLSNYYNTPQGDLYPVMQEKVTTGGETQQTMWPFDGAHPDDKGYEVFFEAVKRGFEKAIADKQVCKLPEKPLFGEYKTINRIKLADTQLPKGWSVAKTYRTSLWFDGLASRWMGDVAMCDAKDVGNIEPLKIEFEGSFLGIFGEANDQGLSFKALVDGNPMPLIKMHKGKEVSRTDIWDMNTSRFGKGNLFMWKKISDKLPPGKHTLEIIPVIPEDVKKGQLRIESVCVAGE